MLYKYFLEFLLELCLLANLCHQICHPHFNRKSHANLKESKAWLTFWKQTETEIEETNNRDTETSRY